MSLVIGERKIESGLDKPFDKRELVTKFSDPGVLLLHITPIRHFPDAFSEPIGIETLAGTMIKNEVPLNLTLGVVRNPSGLEGSISEIESGRYRYIGLGMPIGALEDALTIAQKIDAINSSRRGGAPLIKLLMGGNLPTNLPEPYLRQLVTDYPFLTVVRGWGDIPLVEILQGDLSGNLTARRSIPGLVFMDDDGVHVNDLDPNQDQSALGVPVRVFVSDRTQANIEGSRDCSHPFCTFCARSPYPIREVWKPMSPQAIVNQMADLTSLGLTKGTFTDEEALGTTVTHAVNHAIPLSQAIKDAKLTGKVNPNFTFAFSTRSDSIIALRDDNRLDVLKELQEAGLSRIFLGVESGVPNDFARWDGFDIPPQGRRYGKGINTKQHVVAVEVLREMGIGIEIGFIAFDPLIDLGEIAENAHFLLDNDLARHASEVINTIKLKSGARYTSVVENILERLVENGQLPEKPNLFTDFDLSTLHLGFTYLHPLVGEIAGIASYASDETMNAMYTLKAYYRSRFITGEPTEGEGLDTLTKLRKNKLNLLLGMVNAAQFLLDQQGIPLDEYDRIASGFSSAQVTQEALSEYRDFRNETWRQFLSGEHPDYLREALYRDLPEHLKK